MHHEKLAEAFYPKLELRNIESTIVGDDLILLDAPKFRAECSIHAFDNKEMWEICSQLKHIKSALVGTDKRDIIPLLESVILKLDS
ncbi:hypothetical protein JM79_3253 [Gramella sp. Hel_I_59]|uniref:hypothetical protein n=1 Tax=Gramella sp. Hel_I_59 TaxID=1249978 RepID=UPI001152D7E7|nr:hypothetical protein [Gramella sp. Hel_I_59]TQI72295.1 hypothetical protein JM79_3253 [Gramella sp. Hel_I_59]